MAEYGPFATERDAWATDACAAEHAAWNAPGDGEKFNMRMLLAACEEIGLELGAYDLSPLWQVAMYEASKCAALWGIIRRAYEAGKAAGPDGTVTEWGVRYTRPPGALSGTPAEVRVDRGADRETAGRMMTGTPYREKYPDDTLVCRKVGPWKEVPGGTA